MLNCHVPHMHAFRVLFSLVAVFSASAGMPGNTPPARKPITWEAAFGDDPIDFSGSIARGMTWLDDGRHYLQRRDGQLMRVDAITGDCESAYDVDALKTSLLAHEDFDERQADRLSRRPGSWTADRDAVLIRHKGGLYFYRFSERRLRKLTRDTRPRKYPRLAAGGAAVSFVRDNDLYVIDTRHGGDKRLTRDGSDTLLNGVLDWVYQEEVFGRGHWIANWPREDAKYIAFLQLDETPVADYAIEDYAPLISRIEHTRYPKAGKANPRVRLGIARRKWRRVVWANLSKYDGTDILITRVSWSPGGDVVFSVQDREQRWLDLNIADHKHGRVRTLLRETSPAWVDNLPHPRWLSDGTFLWLSARDGYRHIYHYSSDGRLIDRLTSGQWPVRALLGVDESCGRVYFSGCRETVFETHAYRVPLEGGEIERLTPGGFDHRVTLDPTCRLFLDAYSNVAAAPKLALRRSDGSLVRMISENDVAATREYTWSVPENLQISNRKGLPINLQIIRPPDFNSAVKYPVLVPVYGAPSAQGIRNSWGGRGQLLYQYLVQQGYLVVRIDPHSASGAGARSAWTAYRRIGAAELADIEDALQWLIGRGMIDPGRVGIIGYSYGGFMASYALTHSRMFKMGIAGGPVTDWRNYDSIYTERYMQTPGHNAEGYERASVANAAKDLHGRLLIVHGLRDDNVHFRNTAQLIDALQIEGKSFELMIYPRDRHGIGRGNRHFLELRRRFILENL